MLGDDGIEACRDHAEIGVLHVGAYVVGGLDVGVADEDGCCLALHRGDIDEQLLVSLRARQRHVVERIHGVDAVLGHLMATGYALPVTLSVQKVGLVWLEEETSKRRFEATSRSVRPTSVARSRSTSMCSRGAATTWWRWTSAAPGTLRRSASSSFATASVASRRAPETWTSIGEGSPKFRICVTMSAGWK